MDNTAKSGDDQIAQQAKQLANANFLQQMKQMQDTKSGVTTGNALAGNTTAYIPPATQHSCPQCGYCQHCGRSNHQPYYQPYYQPYWGQGTTYCTAGSAAQASKSAYVNTMNSV